MAALNADASAHGVESGTDARVARWSVTEHWRRLDRYFEDCKSVADGPCFNWHAPHFGSPPSLSDALRCRVNSHKQRGRLARNQVLPTFELGASDAPQVGLFSL